MPSTQETVTVGQWGVVRAAPSADEIVTLTARFGFVFESTTIPVAPTLPIWAAMPAREIDGHPAVYREVVELPAGETLWAAPLGDVAGDITVSR